MSETVWTRRAMLALVALLTPIAPGAAPPEGRTAILVHYMPWFVARPTSPVWGWHWTMDAFDPGKNVAGARSIASHYRPLIGPYDSSDPAVIEYHLLLMKMAGVDGLVVDWYGLSDRLDYPILHRNTVALLAAAGRIGLKVAICYEDATIPKLVEAGVVAPSGRVAHAREVIDWLKSHWFADPAYLRLGGRPVLLSFGSDGLTDREWSEVLPPGPSGPIYLSEHRRRPNAAGGFDWPDPKAGLAAFDGFLASSADWPARMPAAFPRFHDIYAEAKVRPSYGEIRDDSGRTFTTTLRRALATRPPFVQVVTWNDWGEGTAVEPSVEFGYRDLEMIQRLRRESIDPAFAPTPDDLRLAHRLYTLRQRQVSRPALKPILDEVSKEIAAGHPREARSDLDRIEAKGPGRP